VNSWRDTATRKAIVEFVERVTTEGGSDYVAPAERIAVFDNDGTLWCEKPMLIELGFSRRPLPAALAPRKRSAVGPLRRPQPARPRGSLRRCVQGRLRT
jgi:hypothetical protein